MKGLEGFHNSSLFKHYTQSLFCEGFLLITTQNFSFIPLNLTQV